jgi:peptidoglycan/LPS O-acetylase OafA/YrhL
MLVALVVSLGAATVLTFGIERPVQRRFRAWRQRRQAAHAVQGLGAPSSGA